MDAIKSLAQLSKLTEDEAREYLERIRWPNGPVCPHCQSKDATRLQGKSTRPGVYKCKDKGCRKPFTVTVGTIFHRSHVSLRQWLMAFHLVCSSKKGISALQLQRNLGLGSYKSAWHLAHRIRWAMTQEPLASMLRLKGVVEADTTWIGGKPRIRRAGRQGKTSKTPVLALVARSGEARAMARYKVTGKNLRTVLQENIDESARLMTDSALEFRGSEGIFASHETTNHLIGEYVRGDVHSNTVESFFAILKRSVHGIHHHWSKQHLERYLAERAFMWTHRKLDDGQRTLAALKATEGKRLEYESCNRQGAARRAR